MKLNIKKDRIEIAKILQNNVKSMNNYPKIFCQEVADCIILYFIESDKGEK